MSPLYISPEHSAGDSCRIDSEYLGITCVLPSVVEIEVLSHGITQILQKEERGT